jgi:hypothetical protein
MKRWRCEASGDSCRGERGAAAAPRRSSRPVPHCPTSVHVPSTAAAAVTTAAIISANTGVYRFPLAVTTAAITSPSTTTATTVAAAITTAATAPLVRSANWLTRTWPRLGPGPCGLCASERHRSAGANRRRAGGHSSLHWSVRIGPCGLCAHRGAGPCPDTCSLLQPAAGLDGGGGLRAAGVSG